jgi:hypothetical protein
VVLDERRECGVEIDDKSPDQGCVRRPRKVFHHSMKHQPVVAGCIKCDDAAGPAGG